MKEDAKALFLFVAEGGSITTFLGMHSKRAEFLYEKWYDKGLMCNRASLTPEGKRIAEELRNPPVKAPEPAEAQP